MAHRARASVGTDAAPNLTTGIRDMMSNRSFAGFAIVCLSASLAVSAGASAGSLAGARGPPFRGFSAPMASRPAFVAPQAGTPSPTPKAVGGPGLVAAPRIAVAPKAVVAATPAARPGSRLSHPGLVPGHPRTWTFGPPYGGYGVPYDPSDARVIVVEPATAEGADLPAAVPSAPYPPITPIYVARGGGCSTQAVTYSDAGGSERQVKIVRC